jgi:D-alanyl-D-alanine carboxypeptidase
MKIYKIIIISFFTLQAFAFAQGKLNTSKLDSLITAIDINNRAMFTVSIAEKGNVIYHRSVGFIDTNMSVKANETTKYRIGSITKMFTSIIILQLVEEKKLTLDTKLSRFFPKVKNAAKITIEDLLCHQSGIHNFTSDSLYLTYYTLPKTKKELVGLINSGKSDFEPTTVQEYSNSNFVLLGFIIEDITHKTFAENLQDRIVKKIGLNNTYYGSKAAVSKNEARSYKWKNGKWEADSETDMSIPHAAGAIVSTTDDLVKFAHALFSGRLISQASINNMITFRHEWGLGIFPANFSGKKGYGHNGGIDEFGSQLKYLIDDSLSVAITCNGAHYSMKDFMKGVLSCYYDQPYSIPTFIEYKVAGNLLNLYSGIYSSAELKMDLIFTVNGESLIAEATGQPPITLEAESDSVFNFTEAAAVFNFIKSDDGSEDKVILKQGGKEFIFLRKK